MLHNVTNFRKVHNLEPRRVYLSGAPTDEGMELLKQSGPLRTLDKVKINDAFFKTVTEGVNEIGKKEGYWN